MIPQLLQPELHLSVESSQAAFRVTGPLSELGALRLIRVSFNVSNKIMSSSTLFRVCAGSAILAGILRIITSFIPEGTPNVLRFYLVVDLCLLMGVIGLHKFVRAAKLIPLLGTALMILALVALIGRDLGLAPANTYARAALTFSLGLDLFAIHLLQTQMPSWIPVAWLVSTIVGPVGFFVSQLHFLFTISGLIFGIAFAAAGVIMWGSHRTEVP